MLQRHEAPPLPRLAHQPPMYRESPLAEYRPRRLRPSSIQRQLSEQQPYAQLMLDYARSSSRTTTLHGRTLPGTGAKASGPARARFTPLAAAVSLCSSVALALWCVIRFFLRRRR